MKHTNIPGLLHVHVAETLRQRIRLGELVPMDRLPSEADLCQEFDVSRITVRRALDELASEGLIFKIHGKGAFVARPKATQNATVLSGFDEAMARRGHVTRNEVLTLEEVPADHQVATALSIPVDTPVVKLERLRFLDFEPVSLDVTFLPLEFGRPLAGKDLQTRDVFLILENDLNCPLGRARLRMEGAIATKRLASLLDVPVAAPLLKVERLTYDVGGRPVDFEYLYYRSDRFRYEINIQRHRSSEPGAE